MQTKHFVTYGDGIFSKRKDILKQEAIDSYLFHSIYGFGREDIWDFYIRHQYMMDNIKGSGCWIWKPYIIIQLLSSVNDNDLVYYCDSGCSFINKGQFKQQREQRFDYYTELVNSLDLPVIAFSPWTYDYNIPDYTQKNAHTQSALETYGLLCDKQFLDYPGIEAGFIMTRKTKASIDFIQHWLNLLLADNYDLILNHNATDQSLLNALFYKNKMAYVRGTDFYGGGPFFAGRLTDDGCKPGYNSPII